MLAFDYKTILKKLGIIFFIKLSNSNNNHEGLHMPRAKTTTRKTTKKTAAKKVATKKVAAKKTATKKTTASKATAPAKKVATSAVKETFNKSQILTFISDETALPKKQVQQVFDALSDLMHRHLKKRGPGEFTVPGLMKCRVVRKPATKARRGVNPFTGEETTFKAKPARNVVKVRPLKKLKEMAE